MGESNYTLARKCWVADPTVDAGRLLAALVQAGGTLDALCGITGQNPEQVLQGWIRVWRRGNAPQLEKTEKAEPDVPAVAGARRGWVWGDRPASTGRWLTVPGSAHTAPRLAATPDEAGDAPRVLVDPVLALVVEVLYPGVTGPRGVAYLIEQVAD